MRVEDVMACSFSAWYHKFEDVTIRRYVDFLWLIISLIYNLYSLSCVTSIRMNDEIIASYELVMKQQYSFRLLHLCTAGLKTFQFYH